MTSIDVRGLTLSFGDKVVLDDLDLTVPAGTVTAVLGRSGCGKTTLLRAIAGLIRPDRGEIRLGDTVVFDGTSCAKPEARGIGIVPQEGALFPHLDVAANVGFGLPGRGSERDGRIAELLELVGMAGSQDLRPHELSGGMQQRIAVARALSRRPKVVLLDEPFSALDGGLRDAVRADVLAAVRADGATAMLVTHDQDEALSSADRVAVMRAGRIMQEGTPAEVYREPVDLDTARFVGEALELPASVTGTDGEHVTLDSPLGRLAAHAAGSTAPGAHGALVIRPEQLVLTDDPGALRGDDLGTATVTQVRYHGHDVLVTAAMPSGPVVTVRALGTHVPSPGDTQHVLLTTTPRFFAAT
jgi:iron(III) transport system ATP-binding protein